MIVSFAVQKCFSLVRSHLSILAFVAIAFVIFVIKSLPVPMSRMLLLKLPSRAFIVLGFTFKSLIHLKLICVYSVRKGSSFKFLHMASQLSQHHLLNRKLCPLLFFVSFVKDQIVVDVWHYFWVLCSVPLVYVSVFVQYHAAWIIVAL